MDYSFLSDQRKNKKLKWEQNFCLKYLQFYFSPKLFAKNQLSTFQDQKSIFIIDCSISALVFSSSFFEPTKLKAKSMLTKDCWIDC